MLWVVKLRSMHAKNHPLFQKIEIQLCVEFDVMTTASVIYTSCSAPFDRSPLDETSCKFFILIPDDELCSRDNIKLFSETQNRFNCVIKSIAPEATRV